LVKDAVQAALQTEIRDQANALMEMYSTLRAEMAAAEKLQHSTALGAQPSLPARARQASARQADLGGAGMTNNGGVAGGVDGSMQRQMSKFEEDARHESRMQVERILRDREEMMKESMSNDMVQMLEDDKRLYTTADMRSFVEAFSTTSSTSSSI